MAEQERVVSILSAYDYLIENNRRQMHLLEQAGQLLFKEWFVHLRFPGHEHAKMKDGVSEGWERREISEVCETIRRKFRAFLLDDPNLSFGQP